jgi:hypothetical protein
MAQDIEMARIGVGKRNNKENAPKETNYQPVNWKKIFLSPKYIRMSTHIALSIKKYSIDMASSVAYIVHRYRRRNGYHHD